MRPHQAHRPKPVTRARLDLNGERLAARLACDQAAALIARLRRREAEISAAASDWRRDGRPGQRP